MQLRLLARGCVQDDILYNRGRRRSFLDIDDERRGLAADLASLVVESVHVSECMAEPGIIAGMSLRDYQQDFVVNDAVKVSFFAADDPLCKVLAGESETRTARVATLDELFASKCLIAASRSKSRDWFDLYTLMLRHGYTMEQFEGAFAQAGIPDQFDRALQRLCSGVPSRGDEGFEQLASQAPSLKVMPEFFIAQRDAWERRSAARAIQRSDGGMA